MRVVGAELAIRIAIQQLLKGVDYVMDPENNRAKVVNRPYCEQNGGPCVTDLAEAEAAAVTVPYTANLIKWQYTFLGCEWQNSGHNIHCTFEKNGDRRGVFFHSRGASGVSYDRIADQVFANAQQGDETALNYLQSIADEKENDSDKKKKCLPVTEANIRMVLEPTTELATQKRVSLPVIAIYASRVEKGETRLEVQIVQSHIIGGHHRFIVAKLCNITPVVQGGTLTKVHKEDAYPIKNIELDVNDWGNR